MALSTVLRLPIRLRQLPRFVSQVSARERLLRRPVNTVQPVFHLCYFSCESYFRYLYCALDSVVRHVHAPLKIWIFNDRDMPLTASQIERLRALVPGIEVRDWPKSMGWGAAQIESIWRAYALAATGAAEHDYIVRVDSDVFFFNDRIFRAVAASDADLVGDGHFVNFGYAQGGCYFFRATAVRRIVGWLPSQSMDQLIIEAGIGVEDVVAGHIARKVGLRIWLTWFMMFPDELRNAGSLNAWQRFKFSCLHFVMKNKKAMLDAYRSEILLDPTERAAFDAVLDTP